MFGVFCVLKDLQAGAAQLLFFMMILIAGICQLSFTRQNRP